MVAWLSIIRHPAFWPAVFLLAALAFGQVQYWRGHADGKAEVRLELELALAEARRQASRAVAEAEKRRAADEKELKEMQDVVRSLSSDCQLPDSVIERLRRVR